MMFDDSFFAAKIKNVFFSIAKNKNIIFVVGFLCKF